MRRSLVPALVVAMGLTGIHAASGAIIRGTSGPDRLNGTVRADELYGLGGNDRLDGRAAADLIDGGSGRDLLSGGPGPDRLTSSGDLRADTIRCGGGRDIVNAELADRVAADCETVSRQLSRDTSAAWKGQHETQVEPDSFSYGSTLVTVFQSGRLVDGGAVSNGYATTRDRGRTWRSGALPGLTASFFAVSDPVVAYDATHRWWLAASLGLTSDEIAIVVNRSRDGVAWRRPVDAARSTTEEYDKEWIVCDNWASSRFRGRCYLSYMNFARETIETRRSTNGGTTWSAPVSIDAKREAGVVNGVQNVVRPNGDLLLIFSVFGAPPGGDQILAVRSTDGGATFGNPGLIAPLEDADFGWLRAPPFVSADVDAGGRVYVVWRDCLPQAFCTTDIVLASSPDGVRWTAPARVWSISPEGYSFLPAVAVDPATSGRTARLALLYHSISPSIICNPECITADVWLTLSGNGGTTWSRPARLNSVPMQPHWMADTSVGRMLGDYVSVSWLRGRPIPVFSMASAPSGHQFRQAIFATTTLR